MKNNIIKFGDREMVLFTNGDVFCSLSPDELEAERKAAEEDEQRFHDLMLNEIASRMTVDDFVREYKKWEDYQDREEYLVALMERKNRGIDWDEYIYERSSYDTNKATDLKIKRYKKLGMIFDHAYIIIALIIGIYSYSLNLIVSLLMFGLAAWNTIGVSLKWYHMYTERDVPEYVNG